jgi:hypothetical protein
MTDEEGQRKKGRRTRGQRKKGKGFLEGFLKASFLKKRLP